MDPKKQFKPCLKADRHVKFVPNVNAVRYKDAVKSNSENVKSNNSHQTTSFDADNSSNPKRVKFKNRNFVQTGGLLEGTSKFKSLTGKKNINVDPEIRAAVALSSNSTKVNDTEFDQICNDVEKLDIKHDGMPIEIKTIPPRSDQQFEQIFSNESTKFAMFQFPNLLFDLDNIPEGSIGKLVQYKSGRWKFIIGNIAFDLQKSAFKDDAKQICSLMISSNNKQGDLVHLGSVNNLWILSPNEFNIDE